MTRIECDAIGPVSIPSSRRYGPRTARAATLGVSDQRLGDRPSLVRALALVKAAAAVANAAANVLTPVERDRVIEAAAAIAAGCFDPDDFPVDLLLGGGWVAVNANLNEVVGHLAGVAPAVVNASQSTADVCHTAVRLVVLDAVDEVVIATGELTAELTAAAARAASVSTLARTCLRDAHVVPGGRPLAAAVAALDRARHRLAAERGPLQHVVLGATVVGDGAGTPPGYRDAVVAELARLTGRPLLPHPAPASALQHPDDVLAVSTAAARLAATLAKLAGDLRFLAAGPIGGPAELDLPVVLEGSTFYAGKRNPVVPESVIAVAAEVAGHHAAAEQLAGRAELDLNVFDGPAALHAADALDLTTRAAHHLRRHAIAELSVAEDRCAALVRRHLRSLEEPQP